MASLLLVWVSLVYVVKIQRGKGPNSSGAIVNIYRLDSDLPDLESLEVVAHAFNPSSWEVEAGGSR